MSSNRTDDGSRDGEERPDAGETDGEDVVVEEAAGNQATATDGTASGRRIGTRFVPGDGATASWLSRGEVRAGVSETTASLAAHRRRLVLGFASVGVLALIVGVLFPGVRVVMIALGGTGILGALLAATLVPSSQVPTGVGRATYSALADSGASLVTDLGLSEVRIYVRTRRGNSAVRLFVPQTADYVIPDDEALENTLVVTDDGRERGVSIRPTGEALFSAYAGMLVAPGADSPDATVQQLSDALTEQFGLADSITVTEQTEHGVTLRVAGSAYGSLGQFDHPVPSLIATGLARRLDRPVRLTVRTRSLEEDAGVIVCEWDADTA